MSLAAALEIAVRREEVAGPIMEAAFGEIVSGEASAVSIAAFLVALRTKGETVGEIVAAARALRAHSETAPLPDPRCIDTCGTGGDGAGTFNISTTAAFVVAGAGVPVAKHGNRAASSRSGSFDVLEALGVRADLPVDSAARVAREVGIGFFFARRAHPAMRHVAPVRSALGIRTMMNCLGPLLNPVGVRRQLVGVYDAGLVEPLARALADLGAERALVVYGEDGLDEVTTTARTRTALWNGREVIPGRIDPTTFGIPLARPTDLAGGDADENAAIARSVLAGKTGPARDIVLLNAAAALFMAEAAPDLADALAIATRCIDSGAASAKLDALIEASQAV
jgi:anthranilate phosphoribosyltransferase